jgi:hypothetical protein
MKEMRDKVMEFLREHLEIDEFTLYFSNLCYNYINGKEMIP